MSIEQLSPAEAAVSRGVEGVIYQSTSDPSVMWVRGTGFLSANQIASTASLAASTAAAAVGNAPSGIIAATTVQAAIDEIVGEFTAADTTTAALEAVGNAVNTAGKFKGKMLFNTTTSKIVVARGSAAGDTWISCDAATTYTPV